MGLIKPPWISQSWFKKCMFNYCDHFGDKTTLSLWCKVCKQEEKRLQHYHRIGENPYATLQALAHHSPLKPSRRNFLLFAKTSLELANLIKDEFFPEEKLKYTEVGCESYDKIFDHNSSIHLHTI